MDQVRRDPATATAAATSTSWDAYYKEASRRRRAKGGASHWLRAQKRRRRLRERLGIAISAVIVGAMTLAFYLVLTR